jgi:hypothetical protein
MVEESTIWVFCPLVVSSYRDHDISDWVVMMITEWLTDFLEAKAVRAHLMDFPFLEEVDPSIG